jgi:hypothetical protein
MERFRFLPCGNWPIEEGILARKTFRQQQQKLIDATLCRNERVVAAILRSGPAFPTDTRLLGEYGRFR